MKNEPDSPNLLCEKHDAGWRASESCALCWIEELVPLGHLAFWKLIYVGKWGEICLRPGALESVRREFNLQAPQPARRRRRGAGRGVSLYQ